ncbi:MAG: serine/threonine protein kinase, partial [Deltaproteobacteria bacterium]
MPPCPRCGETFDRPINFCSACGADLRGLGAETDTLTGGIIGRVIDDRYRIQMKLGEGGMGAVYRVEHIRMGKVCALKLMRPDLAGRSDFKRMRDRFRQEARIVSRLVHPNTIQVFDFGETEEGELYLAMEYLKGVPLSQALRDAGGRMPEARVARIASQILRSLAEAHEAGIVHRDIKPQNIMLMDLRDRRDFVKVLDFGIAKLVRERAPGEAATGVGEIVGTPNYLSPEQAQGHPPGPRSDLYSLGAMIFEMLTGRAPYVADTPLGVVTAHITAPVPKVRDVAGVEVSEGMQAILERALAKDPEDRYLDADAMRAEIDALLGNQREQTGEIPVLLSDNTASELLVREDFERFARSLVWRRVLSAVAALALVGGIAGAVVGLVGRGPTILKQEEEPNDNPNLANLLVPEVLSDFATLAARRLSLGRSGEPPPLRSVTGYIGRRLSETEGDVDFYRIEVPPGPPRVLFAEVSRVPNIDLVLEVLRESPTAPGTLEVIARSNVPGKGRFEGLANVRVAPGRTYFLQVREVRARDASGQAIPPTENVSDAYRLTVALRPPLEGEEQEPNDSPEEATRLDPGQTRRGFAGAQGQEDWWRVQVPAGHRAVATVTPVQGAQLWITLGRPPADTAGPAR